MKKITALLLAVLMALAPLARAENYGATPALDLPILGETNWGNKLKDSLKDIVDFSALYANPDGTLKYTTSASPWQTVTGPVTWLSTVSFKVPSTALFDDVGRKVWIAQATPAIGSVLSASTAGGETTVTLENVVLYSDLVTPTDLTNPITSVSVSAITPRSTPIPLASQIKNTPAGGISATTTQGAINELDTEKAATGHNHDATYAPVAKGVTNGDSHDHAGGDGAQIAHSALSGVGTNTHAQIDTHIADTANPHGVTKAQVGLGSVVDAAQVRVATADTITAQHSFAPASAQAPFALGANAQGQLVTGLNADTVDGSHASAFATSGHNHDATYAPVAKGVTNGDSHDHAGGDGAQISLASGVTGTLPIANGGTGQTSAGSSGQTLISNGSAMVWASTSRPNNLINSAFTVWQRGTSFTGASGVFTADRWYAITTAGSTTFTISRQTSSMPEGFSYSLRAQRNSGATWTDQIRVGQPLVTLDSIPMANKTVTLSFWAKKGADFSPASSYLYSNFQEGRGIDQSAATSFTSPSGWTSPATWSQTNVLTTSWQRFTHTRTIDSLTTQLSFFFAMIPTGTAGTNDWFEITGIKVEIGSVATEFEHEPFAQTLAKCQRYYRKLTHTAINRGFGSGNGVSSGLGLIYISFPVQMRTVPTMGTTGAASDYYVSALGACSASPTLFDASVDSARVRVDHASITANMGLGLQDNATTAAYLAFDSEL